MNFTKAVLENLTCPAGADRLYLYDAKLPSLAFCVTAGGARSFYVYRRVLGRPKRVHVGRFPDLSIEQARTEAGKIIADIARGIDPTAKKKQALAEATLADAWREWLTEAKAKNFRTVKEIEQRYETHLKRWAKRRLSEITRSEIKALHHRIGAARPVMANRILTLLRTLFNKGIAELNYAGLNPTKDIDGFAENERERFLRPDEMPRFFAALSAEPSETARDFLMLLLFTGARRANVEGMRWADVTLEAGLWTIPAGEAKTGKEMKVVLPPQAIEILKRREKTAPGEWVFPAKSECGHITDQRKAWRRILKRAEIADLRIHDLRRTLGSWQAATGASLPVIGKTLGHREQRTTQIYARLDLDPVRSAVNVAVAAMAKAAKNGRRVKR